MALTPVEIRHLTFGRGLLGYKRFAVDRLLAEIAASFEDVWRERADFADRIEQLETELVRFRELETLLRQTLVAAERAAAETRDQAAKQADLLVREAHAEAREILRRATVENERLSIECGRMRERLRLALASLEPGAEEASGQTKKFDAA